MGTPCTLPEGSSSRMNETNVRGFIGTSGVEDGERRRASETPAELHTVNARMETKISEYGGVFQLDGNV